MHVKFIDVLSHSWKMLLSSRNMQDKKHKKEPLTKTEHIDMSQKWRIASVKRRLC